MQSDRLHGFIADFGTKTKDGQFAIRYVGTFTKREGFLKKKQRCFLVTYLGNRKPSLIKLTASCVDKFGDVAFRFSGKLTWDQRVEDIGSEVSMFGEALTHLHKPQNVLVESLEVEAIYED